jgi:hypothetical protein
MVMDSFKCLFLEDPLPDSFHHWFRRVIPMLLQTGFDNEKYLAGQTKAIIERITGFDNKLYLKSAGKPVFDHHASRVLPGFDPNVNVRLLQ